jgi:WbqC-like protein
MNVVIMQPFYLFLRKHFHQIQRADTYVFLDDVQFVKDYHHNRNRIKSAEGPVWLTVPVRHRSHRQLLMETEIDNTKNWRFKHWRYLEQNYARAPFFKDYAAFFRDCYKRPWSNLCDLNIYLIENISRFLGIDHVRFMRSSELGIGGETPTQRIINICEHLGGSRYIIGTRAKDYMEEDRWQLTNVELEWFEPQYPPYPQLYGSFVEHCAIVDLLFNAGPRSGDYIWGAEFQRFQQQLSETVTAPTA